MVGRVIEVTKHPNGAFIRLAHVDLGNGSGKVQIVFGGHDNVRGGCLVPVAPPGARVPGKRRKLRRERFRGTESFGMLCSLTELGWAQKGPDEVALLRHVREGDSLDDIAAPDRRRIVRPSESGEPIEWATT